MKIQDPIQLFFITIFMIIIGFVITVVLSFQVNLHGKHAFTQAPENPMVLKGQEIYYQEGCQYCHTTDIRTIKTDIYRFMDIEKYGLDPSVEANEFLFFAPFPLGEQRIGPDLAAISSKYTKEELSQILQGKKGKKNSYLKNYHNYSYLFIDDNLQPLFLSWKIRWLMNSGLPFNDPYQRSVFLALQDHTKGDALIEFLQYLGKRKQQFEGKFYQ